MRARFVVIGLALVAATAIAVPAIAGSGPSAKNSASAEKTAKKALKKAKKATKIAKGKPDLSNIVTVVIGVVAIPPGGLDSAIAFCGPGERVVSGGGSLITGVGDGIAISESNLAGTAWFVIGANNSVFTSGTISAEASCAEVGKAVGAGAGRAETRSEVASLIDELEAAVEREG